MKLELDHKGDSEQEKDTIARTSFYLKSTVEGQAVGDVPYFTVSVKGSFSIAH